MVTSLRASRTLSALSAMHWPVFPPIAAVLASTPSRSPNFWMNWAAFFSPTPGTPGTLSDVSPIRERRSMMRSGPTPHFSRISSGP